MSYGEEAADEVSDRVRSAVLRSAVFRRVESIRVEPGEMDDVADQLESVSRELGLQLDERGDPDGGRLVTWAYMISGEARVLWSVELVEGEVVAYQDQGKK